jgi:adiponectin receptor
LGGAALTDTHCPRQSLVRTVTFALLVTFGLVPSLHWCLLVPPQVRAIFLDNLIGMFISYGVGFGFWFSRFPERFFPHTAVFGLWFSSHQLWHLCIFLAVRIWLAGILEMHLALHELGCGLLS